MKIEITLKYSSCSGTNIKKNGRKYNQKQNYFCKASKRQFISHHALTYTELVNKVLLMLVCGLGIRSIAELEQVSIKKALSVLINTENS